jgi:hypothetical protein
MVDPNWLKTSAGVKMPRIIYGMSTETLQRYFD